MLGLADDQLDASTKSAIKAVHFGSVWFTDNSSAGVARIHRITASVQAMATNGVRFFIAANQEGGEIQAMKGSGFSTIPAATTQGTFAPPTLSADATRWGRELRAAGITFNFAPVFDVVPPGTEAQNQPIGVLHREYGHDVPTVAAHALAFVRGMMAAGVETSAKHFPGLGRVQGNTDYTGNVVDNVTTTADLGSFEQAVNGGVPFVMVALATYTQIDPNALAVFSPIVIKQVLRGKLGFKGVVMSDDLGATVAVKNIPPGARAISFLQAGGDMIISKTLDSARIMYTAIVQRMSQSRSFSTTVEQAVMSILRAKRAAGLLACG
jgi:beta-N-acetylhexosaminidase